MARKEGYVITQFMINLYNDLVEYKKAHPDSTGSDLAEHWGVHQATASKRLETLRKCGYKDAVIRRKRKSEYAARGSKKKLRGEKELNIDGEISNSKFDYDYEMVRSNDIGDSRLSECAHCKALERKTFHGETPHYVMQLCEDEGDGIEVVLYCPSCGYEPLLNFDGRITKITHATRLLA